MRRTPRLVAVCLVIGPMASAAGCAVTDPDAVSDRRSVAPVIIPSASPVPSSTTTTGAPELAPSASPSPAPRVETSPSVRRRPAATREPILDLPGLPSPVANAAHRALIVGDSLVFDQRTDLARRFAAVGIETRFVGGWSTGLLTSQTGWIDGIQREIEGFVPDVVLIESCCNYGRSAAHPERGYYVGGRLVRSESDEMYALWAVAADEAVRRASSRGARVWWMLVPEAPITHSLHDRIERFTEIYRNLAGQWPNLRFIDWAQAFTKPDGTPGAIPRNDGVHFTWSGYARVAEYTVSVVTNAMALDALAVSSTTSPSTTTSTTSAISSTTGSASTTTGFTTTTAGNPTTGSTSGSTTDPTTGSTSASTTGLTTSSTSSATTGSTKGVGQA